MISRPVATTRIASSKTTKRPACRSSLVGFGWGRRLSIVTDGEPLLWLKLIKLLLDLIDDLLYPVRDSAQIAILNIGVNIERSLDIVMANDHRRSVSDDRC